MPLDLWLSCLLNRATGGKYEEPLCSRIWRLSLQSDAVDAVRAVLDFCFLWKEKEHCYQCFLRYLRRR